MVGTPCQILAATKINKYEKQTGGSPIDVKIGLFCMENFSYSYLERYLKQQDIELYEVREFRIDKGKFIANLIDGRVFKIPIAETEPFTRKNCHICTDYTSDTSDISVGSVGSPNGYSTVIVRSKKGRQIIEDCIDKGYIAIDEITLQNDVISVGSCVLCGACEYVCPIDSIQINHRKPVSKKECEPDCHACYFACPRTFVSEEIYPSDIDEKPLGNYLDIYCVKADSIIGQDGGVVSAILVYLLENDVVDAVSIVGEDKDAPWRPQSKLTSSVQDVITAAGTKYSTTPIGFKALNK